ncbi:hypothetical protein MTsPCn5_27240 [Croceitalea sp. MTPC5]|nr:hypothetical protein MTsPCn5_27240 [Croceitalea sp. MTPC5]
MGPLKTSFFLLFLWVSNVTFGMGIPLPTVVKDVGYHQVFLKDSIKLADYHYNLQQYQKAIPLYQKGVDFDVKNKGKYLKKLALCEAGLGNSKKSTAYLEQLLITDFDVDFINHEGFDKIRSTSEFKSLDEKYIPKHNIWSFVYLFIAAIGFYTAILINFNKKIEVSARLLISAFIFIHSVFIFHISIAVSNYQYEYPHSYLMSTGFSFLYGPLLYLYFRKVVLNKKFGYADLLHLIPTLVFLVYIIPIYTLSHTEKLSLMLQRVRQGLNPSDSELLVLLVLLKLTSLIVYGYFIRKLYFINSKKVAAQNGNNVWQRNLYAIHMLYVCSYGAYGILISNTIASGVLYHFQVLSMALMVLYLGYSANIQPIVFNGVLRYTNQLFPKYEKSGLTFSLSLELKNNLEHLFEVDKIYKENTINLEMVAERLNTTRHNTSQIINEHFNLSFHELVNKYRIQEAKEILCDDQQRNLNIIDIAYEVGYNNKVTFNKAFKKDTQLTPSQFLKLMPPLRA